MNFFFDDLDGLLGARILDRNNAVAGTVQELIVDKDGAITDMIVTVPAAEQLSATSPAAERIYRASAGADQRRKVPTDALLIVRTVSGGMAVRVEDHVADLQEFPVFKPAPAID